MILLSAYEAQDLIKAYKTKSVSVEISLDLGITKTRVILNDGYFIFSSTEKLSVEHINKIIKKDTICFSVENNSIVPVSIFSEETNNYYKLVPTGKNTWPTLEISGIRMHVTKKFLPKEDTLQKISFISPCKGKVLDICTGLGYTAMMAAKTADEVYTIEKDTNVIEIEKINPYSKDLFENSKIKRINGDAFFELKKINDYFFDRIIHDPPRLSLATTLYSQEFYQEIFRVLNKHGKIYHYTGDPGNKRGLDIRAGIIKRMSKSGFINIKRVFNGVTAEKST